MRGLFQGGDMQQITCPTGKVPLDAKRAKQVAKRSSASHDRPMQPYKCDECGAWHVGARSRLRPPMKRVYPVHEVRTQ